MERASLVLEDLKGLAQEFNDYLKLTTFSVAVKLIQDPQTLSEVHSEGKPVRQVQKQLAVCQILAQARYVGRVIAGTCQTLNLCRPGAHAFGFEKFSIEEIARPYIGSYALNREIAIRGTEGIPRLEFGKYKALLAAPLDKIPVLPDVVLFYGNTAQMMRLIHGYNYERMERLTFTTNGEAGGCSDPVITPLLTRKPSLAFPCNGARILSWPSDDEAVMGIPLECLMTTLRGLQATHRGGIRYPIAWQHIDWEPQPPVLYFLRPDRKPPK